MGMSENQSIVAPTVVRLAQYTKADQEEILGNSDDPFGVAWTGLTWLPKEEHFGIRHHGRLVAHAGLLRLPVAISDAETEVVGVGGVAVSPAMQGQGFARLVVTAALEHARTMGPQHALLTHSSSAGLLSCRSTSASDGTRSTGTYSSNNPKAAS
ncbi:hypothetical protein SROCM77S_06717 [Streptomyces rochei]